MNSTCKVVRYTEEYSSSLFNYMKKTFPNYSDEYIYYCLRHAIDNASDRTAFIVLNELHEIVGCHMYFLTQAMINGNVVNTSWGHDTILDDEYRKEASIDFIVKINKVAAFGIGVTDVNEKIQKSLRTKFISGLSSVLKFNENAIFLNLFSKKRIRSFKSDESISVEDYKFKLTEKSDQINIPSGGFWYSDICNVDFLRDRPYLEDRFYENKAFKYYVYTVSDEYCYFVVRPIIFRHIPVLSLVDFRYNYKNLTLQYAIIKATEKIARKNHLGGILVVSNDEGVKKYAKMGVSLSRDITLVANKYLKLKDDVITNVTSADADVDYQRSF